TRCSARRSFASSLDPRRLRCGHRSRNFLVRRAAATGIALMLLAAPGRLQIQPSVVTIGPNVQVSAAKDATMHGEGLIVTHPIDAGRLLVCSMFRNEEIGQGVAAYMSGDGGVHWERTFESPVENPAGDPACAFGPDGAAYLTMIPMKHPSQATIRLPLLRSEDGAKTWRTIGFAGFLDRESLVVDGTGGRFHNRIYLHGAAGTQSTTGLSRETLRLYASADGGRTFGRATERVAMNRRTIFGMGNSVVLSDGRWLAVFGEIKAYFETADSNVGDFEAVVAPPPEPENAWLRAVASDDGGDSLNDPATISGWHMPNPYVRHSPAIPTVACDATNGPFGDRLYVAWPDTRFGGT